MSLINSGKRTIEVFQYVVYAMNKIGSRSLAYIFSLMFMCTATSSYAVKCVQAGYTVQEGAIICIPSYITDTYYESFVGWPSMSLGPFDTFGEAEGAMINKLESPPYCAQATTGGGPIVDETWGSIGNGETQRISYSGDYVSGPYDNESSTNCIYGGTGYWVIRRTEKAICEGGHKIYDWFYVHEGGNGTLVCGDPPPAKECTVGNPIGIMHGTKMQHEFHINANNSGQVPLSWHYVSSRQSPEIPSYWIPLIDLNLLTIERKGWRHSYDKRLDHNFNDNELAYRPTLQLTRPSQADNIFLVKISNNWVDAMSNIPHQIEEQLDEPIERWKYTDTSGNIEIYNPDGALIKQIDKQGRVTSLSYNNGKLVKIINWKGNSLSFNYDSVGKMQHITDSLGHIYHYEFNGNLLSSVTFPDTTPDDLTDNPVRQYLYENIDLPGALTGIIDENGERYATWTYDSTGGAVSSSHGDNVDTTALSIGNTYTVVTNPLGKKTKYRFRTRNNLKQTYKAERYSSEHTPYAYKQYYYDTQGRVTSQTNWRGYRTTYSHDSEGREVSRTEAYGRSNARTTTTTWDTQFNKPRIVTEPNRITEYTYDAEGRVLSKTQRPNP